jgi:hypothetical protein
MYVIVSCGSASQENQTVWVLEAIFVNYIYIYMSDIEAIYMNYIVNIYPLRSDLINAHGTYMLHRPGVARVDYMGLEVLDPFCQLIDLLTNQEKYYR